MKNKIAMINWKLQQVNGRTKVIMEPTHNLIKEFTTLKEKFGNKKGEELMLYIFFMCDLSVDNFLRDVDIRHKTEQAKFRAFNDINYEIVGEELKCMESAMRVYCFYSETPEERMLNTFDIKIDEYNHKIQETKPQVIEIYDKEQNVVDFKSNGKILTDMQLDVEKLMNTKQKLKRAVMGQVNTGRVKADATSSIAEKGLLIPHIDGSKKNKGTED